MASEYLNQRILKSVVELLRKYEKRKNSNQASLKQLNISSTMQNNERFIKLSLCLPFDKEIALGQDITLIIEENHFIANCVKIDHSDLQNGTMNIVYNFEFLSE